MADYIGDTQVDVTKEQLVVGMMQMRLRQSSQFISSIMDVSDRAVPGAKSISYPRFSAGFTVNKLPYPHDDDAVQTACEPQRLTVVEDELLLNQHPNIVWEIPDSANLQSKVDLELAALDEATFAHGDSIDKEIYAELFAAATAGPVTTGSTLDDILTLKMELKKANVPMEIGNIFAALDPDAEKDILLNGSPKITDASVYGNNTPLVRGEIGMIYGVRLLSSNNADSGLMVYHRNAMIFGLQKTPNYETDRNIKCKTTEYAVDQFYGKQVMQGGAFAAKLT